MIKFEAGKSYYDRSACNHDCIFAYTVKKRTPKTAVLIDAQGKEQRRKIYIYGNEEHISLGSYSMAPVLTAKNELPGEGTLRERLDEMHKADMNAAQKAHIEFLMKMNFEAFANQ